MQQLGSEELLGNGIENYNRNNNDTFQESVMLKHHISIEYVKKSANI